MAGTVSVTYDVVQTLDGAEMNRIEGYLDRAWAAEMAEKIVEGHFGALPKGASAHVERVIVTKVQEKVWGT